MTEVTLEFDSGVFSDSNGAANRRPSNRVARRTVDLARPAKRSRSRKPEVRPASERPAERATTAVFRAGTSIDQLAERIRENGDLDASVSAARDAIAELPAPAQQMRRLLRAIENAVSCAQSGEQAAALYEIKLARGRLCGALKAIKQAAEDGERLS